MQSTKQVRTYKNLMRLPLLLKTPLPGMGLKVASKNWYNSMICLLFRLCTPSSEVDYKYGLQRLENHKLKKMKFITLFLLIQLALAVRKPRILNRICNSSMCSKCAKLLHGGVPSKSKMGTMCNILMTTPKCCRKIAFSHM